MKNIWDNKGHWFDHFAGLGFGGAGGDWMKTQAGLLLRRTEKIIYLSGKAGH